jgi:hypothetical protein
MVRSRLRGVADIYFRNARLITLTIDRKAFGWVEGMSWEEECECARAAHARIVGKGYIAQLMRRCNVRYWVATMEVHPSSPAWVHWHVLADLSHTGGHIPYRQLWKYWGNVEHARKNPGSGLWGLGGVHVARGGHKFKSCKHAVDYVTKYLTKGQKVRWPDWVLDSHKRVRFISASKAIGALVTRNDEASFEEQAAVIDAAERVREQQRADRKVAREYAASLLESEPSKPRRHVVICTAREALGLCRERTELVEETRYADGSIMCRYIETIDGRPADIADLVASGGLRDFISGQAVDLVIDESEEPSKYKLHLEYREPVRELSDVIESIKYELENRGVDILIQERIAGNLDRARDPAKWRDKVAPF